MAGVTTVRVLGTTIDFGTLSGSSFTANTLVPKIVGHASLDRLDIIPGVGGTALLTAINDGISFDKAVTINGGLTSATLLNVNTGLTTGVTSTLTANGPVITNNTVTMNSSPTAKVTITGNGNGTAGNPLANLELVSTDSALGPTLSFNRGNGTRGTKIWFGADNILHFGGWSDTADGGIIKAGKVYGAVYNDIADFIEVNNDTEIEFGYAYSYNGKEHKKTTKYAEKGVVGIASDTYGFGVGQKSEGKQIPIAIGGFVLAHTDKVYEPGTPLTCTKKGILTKMKWYTRIFNPERLLGTFYKKENRAKWHGIFVVERHWVQV